MPSEFLRRVVQHILVWSGLGEEEYGTTPASRTRIGTRTREDCKRRGYEISDSSEYEIATVVRSRRVRGYSGRRRERTAPRTYVSSSRNVSPPNAVSEAPNVVSECRDDVGVYWFVTSVVSRNLQNSCLVW